jgi:hypothetical protein
MPNTPAAPNPAIASQLNAEHHWRGFGEPERWRKPHNTMKTHIALLLATVTLLITSCSKSPKLTGDWAYNGQSCHVLQNGTDLTFINERGDKSGGTIFTEKSQVIALDWEGGLRGDLAENATRINWKNNTVWIKKQ